MYHKKMKTYTIGISCIGSGVGQSVINSLKHSRLPLKTVGLGTNPFAYGAYDCDYYDYTKTIYAPGYIDDLLEKCAKHKIDLVIPGLDDEALIFAQNADKFEAAGVKAMFASEALIALCRDKERMSLELNPIADVFVKCYNKNTLQQDITNGKVQFPFIAKPRGGFASRGVEILLSEADLTKINEEHIVQELAVPRTDDPNRAYYLKQIAQNKNPQIAEISIQLVYSPEGILMGRMASYNKLNNGIPIEILPYDEPYLWEVIDSLTPYFLKLGLIGPLNIQGRLTDSGLKLFEMNPRFTGITGLRALMGFNEVEACVKEWLGIDKGQNQLQFNYGVFGMRQTADKAVPIARNKEIVTLSDQLGQKGYKRKERLFITGVTGYLGQNLVNKLLEENRHDLWLFGRDKKKLEGLYLEKVDRLYDMEDYEMGRIPFGNIDVLLHLGFARPQRSNQEIANSLKFTLDLFSRAANYNVPYIVNISSQSVYGTETMPLWNEEATHAMPATPYAQAKYATEVHLSALKGIFKSLRATSVRLGTLAGHNKDSTKVDVLSVLVKKVKDNQDIPLMGGTQKVDRLDIRDAVSGLIKLIHEKQSINKDVYNLSSGKQYTMLEVAQKILAVAERQNRAITSEIKFEQIEKKFPSFGMDISNFCKTFKWKPSFALEETIQTLF
jgi:nucleoside-diphosphate-sugar epimerase/carbamoylphosphate synthase large subunit